MKRLIGVFAVLIVLVSFTLSEAQLPDFPFVYAEGKAELELPPNIATVSFLIREFDEDSEDAMRVVTERSAELLAFLGELKIQDKDIRAYEITKSAEREMGREYASLRILGYDVHRSVKVTLRNLTKYEQLVKKLLSMNNIERVDSNFDRTDREKIKEDLITKACQNAREQAKLLAMGSGVQLGNVYAVSQENFQSLSIKFGVSGVAAGILSSQSSDWRDDKHGLFFVPSTITFRNSVRVIFKLSQEE